MNCMAIISHHITYNLQVIHNLIDFVDREVVISLCLYGWRSAGDHVAN